MSSNSPARSVSNQKHQNIAAQWRALSDFILGLLKALDMTGDDELFPGFVLRPEIKEQGQQAVQLWRDRNGAAAVNELRKVKIAILVTLRSFCEKTLCADLRKDLTDLRLAPELHSQGETAIVAFQQMLVSAIDRISGFDPYGAAKQYRDIEDLLNGLEDRQKELRALRMEQERVARAKEQAAKRERIERKIQRRVEETQPLLAHFS